MTRTRQDIYKILKIHFGSGWSGLGSRVFSLRTHQAGMRGYDENSFPLHPDPSSKGRGSHLSSPSRRPAEGEGWGEGDDIIFMLPDLNPDKGLVTYWIAGGNFFFSYPRAFSLTSSSES